MASESSRSIADIKAAVRAKLENVEQMLDSQEQYPRLSPAQQGKRNISLLETPTPSPSRSTDWACSQCGTNKGIAAPPASPLGHVPRNFEEEPTLVRQTLGRMPVLQKFRDQDIAEPWSPRPAAARSSPVAGTITSFANRVSEISKGSRVEEPSSGWEGKDLNAAMRRSDGE